MKGIWRQGNSYYWWEYKLVQIENTMEVHTQKIRSIILASNSISSIYLKKMKTLI